MECGFKKQIPGVFLSKTFEFVKSTFFIFVNILFTVFALL